MLIFLATAATSMASRNTMTVLAAGGRGSGTSSWPPMKRPTAEGGENGSAAIMNYVSSDCTEISTRRDLGGSDDALIGAIWSPTAVSVGNARLPSNQMSLDGNGFELVTNSNTDEVDLFHQLDFCNQDQVVGDYYTTCEHIVADAFMSQSSAKSSTRIAHVCAFDHNVRSSDRASVGKITSKRDLSVDPDDEKTATATPQVQNPAGLVHADYTKVSAPRRLLDLSKEPKLNDVLRPKLGKRPLLDPKIVQEALDGKRRYAFVNVWRSIDTEKVNNPPLACADATTVSVDDLRTFKIHYVDRVGENYFVCCPSPGNSSDRRHSWYYYPDMTMTEALLLKQWDSMGGMARGAKSDGTSRDCAGAAGGGLSTFTIHSAFLDPLRPDNPPRKSIEVRCVVIWEKED